jgi:hypothetical protein
VKQPSMQLLVAEEDKVCCECGGTIPKGHKYWQNNHGHHGAEHTNCLDYSTELTDHRRRPTHYDAAV